MLEALQEPSDIHRMRIIARIFVLGLLVAAAMPLSTFSGVPAHAVCGSTQTLSTALDRANSVFVGEVASTSDAGRTATVRVLEVWKGRDLTSTVIVLGRASSGESQNNRTFQVGRTYLIESRDTRSPFDSDRCTATKLYIPLGGRVIPSNLTEAVGATQGRPPLSTLGEEEETGGERSILPFINVGLVLLGVLGAALMYRKVTRFDSRSARAAASRAAEEKDAKTTSRKGPDSLAKVGRKLSITGSVGRSGMDSSRRLRKQGRRGKGARR